MNALLAQKGFQQLALQKLDAADFEGIFGEKLSDYVRGKINSYRFEYRPLGSAFRDQCIREISDILMNKDLEKSGQHRLQAWERGWGENLENLSKEETLKAIVPRYFEKFPVLRWKQDFIQSASENFEYSMLSSIQHWIFDSYLRQAPAVYEFGCGTGHNLLRVRDVNPKAALWGLDWATSSQGILKGLKEKGVDSNIQGHRFNFFEPDTQFKIEKGGAVMTIAALEQVGSNHGAFVDYLLKSDANLFIHIEPIGELLDPSHLIDFLSLQYFQKRNYLNGYLKRLRELESEKQIEIVRAQRSFIGSYFIDGYSVIVWKKK